MNHYCVLILIQAFILRLMGVRLRVVRAFYLEVKLRGQPSWELLSLSCPMVTFSRLQWWVSLGPTPSGRVPVHILSGLVYQGILLLDRIDGVPKSRWWKYTQTFTNLSQMLWQPLNFVAQRNFVNTNLLVMQYLVNLSFPRWYLHPDNYYEMRQILQLE